MKIIGQICHGEFFMHMSDSYPEKMEGSILISYTFVRRQLISLVSILVCKVSIATQSIEL